MTNATLVAEATGAVLPTLATYSAEEATPARVYAGEGTNIGMLHKQAKAQNNPQYRKDLDTVSFMYEAALQGGRRARFELSEAMTRSDFSVYLADIIDRQTLGLYNSMPVQWDRIARRGRVSDFRAKKMYFMDGAQSVLDEVEELAPYPATALTDGKYEYSVKKRGKRVPWSWELQIGDDLELLADTPQRLANAARFSEERFATSLYVGVDGPNGTFFSGGNANVVTGNPVLSIAALQTAFTVLSAQKDSDGNPIFVDAVTLVVPPALQVTAENILNATQIEVVEAGGTANQKVIAANWMRSRVSLMVNPWLPIIASNSNGNTQWYLFASPSAGRPAMEVGFLNGHESPELFMKSPNAVRIGGGLVSPAEGDYDTDAIEMKIRHVFGGVLMDPKMAVASQGDGS